MNDVINPVKLKELEDKVDQFHHYMVCYKNADQKKDLKRMSEASSLDEFDAEKAALLAEYMMDFAMQTSDYALLSVMKANDAQLRLEEKEA